jgi:hypothetical protein
LSPAVIKRDEFSASRQQREAQGSPKGRDSGVPFLRSFLGKQKGTYKKHYFYFMFIFFAYPKKTNQKKR